MSVAQVARRYAVDANIIFKSLKDPRFAPEAESPVDDAITLPVEIDGDVIHDGISGDMPRPFSSAPLSASRADITLSDGRRILIEGPTALAAVVNLVPACRFDHGSLQHTCLAGRRRYGHAAWVQYVGRAGREGFGA